MDARARLAAAEPDECLVALARAGHQPAFEAVVDRYRRPLLRRCRRLTPSDAHAEDVLQQGLLNAWLALRRGADVHELRAWLYRVMHNAAVDAARSERSRRRAELGAAREAARTEQLLGQAAAASAACDQAMMARDALEHVARLPELQREAVVRTALVGDSRARVAGELGISDDAVRGLLYRARTRLRASPAASPRRSP
jgi:RNA polymerase sigma factor (sigma-70 family)